MHVTPTATGGIPLWPQTWHTWYCTWTQTTALWINKTNVVRPYTARKSRWQSQAECVTELGLLISLPPYCCLLSWGKKKKKTPLKNMKKGLTGSLCCYSHHICRGTITSSSVCFHIQTEKLLMWSEPQQHMLVLNNSTERLKRHPAAKNEKYRSNVLTNNCSHFLRHPTTLKNFKTQRKSWSPLSTSSKFSGQNINNYKKKKN